jgi:hypothetical protein
MLRYATVRYAMLRYATLCYAMLCYAMLCYAMLCFAMLRYATLRYAMLCYCMLCYAICCAMLYAICFMLYAICYMLMRYAILGVCYAICYMICYMLYAICYARHAHCALPTVHAEVGAAKGGSPTLSAAANVAAAGGIASGTIDATVGGATPSTQFEDDERAVHHHRTAPSLEEVASRNEAFRASVAAGTGWVNEGTLGRSVLSWHTIA